jgi:hypothetical protein
VCEAGVGEGAGGRSLQRSSAASSAAPFHAWYFRLPAASTRASAQRFSPRAFSSCCSSASRRSAKPITHNSRACTTHHAEKSGEAAISDAQVNHVCSKQRTRVQASKQASKQASEQASERASKQASEQASKRASKQASKQASERSFIVASSVRSILYYIIEDRTREAGVAANDDNMPREVLAIVDRTLGQHISNHLMHTGIVVPAQPGVE